MEGANLWHQHGFSSKNCYKMGENFPRKFYFIFSLSILVIKHWIHKRERKEDVLWKHFNLLSYCCSLTGSNCSDPFRNATKRKMPLSHHTFLQSAPLLVKRIPFFLALKRISRKRESTFSTKITSSLEIMPLSQNYASACALCAKKWFWSNIDFAIAVLPYLTESNLT